jgi:hypothetical protein
MARAPIQKQRGPRLYPKPRRVSDRQSDLAHQTGENEHAAQAVALALIRQEQTTEADERGERHSDLTSSVHVSFPQHFPPMNRAIHNRSPGLRQSGLREAFVFGLIAIGEKQEQSKN